MFVLVFILLPCNSFSCLPAINGKHIIESQVKQSAPSNSQTKGNWLYRTNMGLLHLLKRNQGVSTVHKGLCGLCRREPKETVHDFNNLLESTIFSRVALSVWRRIWLPACYGWSYYYYSLQRPHFHQYHIPFWMIYERCTDIYNIQPIYFSSFLQQTNYMDEFLVFSRCRKDATSFISIRFGWINHF